MPSAVSLKEESLAFLKVFGRLASRVYCLSMLQSANIDALLESGDLNVS